VGHLREVTTMIDFRTAKILGHRRNIQRYARLLAGSVGPLRAATQPPVDVNREQCGPMPSLVRFPAQRAHALRLHF
jgi:hypothetical protein